jgi:hypothetical protein
MHLQLQYLPDNPALVAASKSGVEDLRDAFFLDFSRPLERVKWRGWGWTVGLIVPVAHAGEASGEYVVSVHRADPNYRSIFELWNRLYPSPRQAIAEAPQPLELIAAFGAHFPEDAE